MFSMLWVSSPPVSWACMNSGKKRPRLLMSPTSLLLTVVSSCLRNRTCGPLKAKTHSQISLYRPAASKVCIARLCASTPDVFENTRIPGGLVPSLSGLDGTAPRVKGASASVDSL